MSASSESRREAYEKFSINFVVLLLGEANDVS